MKRLIRFLHEFFIPERYKEDENDYRKARILVNTILITEIFAIIYYGNTIQFDMPDHQLTMIVCVVLFPVFAFMFKWGVSKNLVANLYVLVATVGTFFISFFAGGLYSFDIAWFTLGPVVAVLLATVRSGWFWLIVNTIIVLTIGLMTMYDYPFTFRIDPDYKDLMFLNSNMGFLWIIFLIAVILENASQRALLRLGDKNEIIEKEKKRSDDLLSNILPHDVIEELQEKGHSEAKLFNDVTVFFSDFVNFTHISESLSPQALVGELNYYFKAFDDIVSKYGLEKIKTIGDAYMATGGLYSDDESTHLAVINAALEMQEVVSERREERTSLGLPYFEMRVGIHTGPVVAGIVGVKKFQYDIWGDTVNTASRMESAGEPRMVNISESTYRLVKDSPDLKFQSRGVYDVKGKGDMKMYFVEWRSTGVGAET